MKQFFAISFAVTLCLLAGCAAPGSAGNDSSAAAGSGITVFGTIDAGVSSYKNR